jgi:hypothetical protein
MRREQAVVEEVSSSTSRQNPSLLNSVSTHIDQLVIIDRNVDLYTPLCTQLTYEGLIDEIFRIKHCKWYEERHVSKIRLLICVASIAFVELDPSLVTTTPAPGQSASTQPVATPAGASAAVAAGKKKNYALNSGDKLFSQLCDLNFAVVGGLLNKIAKRINENYEV